MREVDNAIMENLLVQRCNQYADDTYQRRADSGPKRPLCVPMQLPLSKSFGVFLFA
jgi:hypothetical protein